jgi:hypothetical protein
VPEAQLTAWATKLLGIEPTEEDSVRYDSILGDDFATQNMDVYIYISEGILDSEGVPKFDNLTLRVEGVSVGAANLEGELGTETPAWIDDGGENNFESLSTFLITDEPVALNDLVTTFELITDEDNGNFNGDEFPLPIPVLANDLFNGKLLTDVGEDGVTVTVNEVGGLEITQDLDEAVGEVSVNNTGDFPTIDFTPAEGFTGLATFKYTVTVSGQDSEGLEITNVVSNEATVQVRVNAFPDPDAPIAANDSAVTFFDTPVSIDVLANDTLPEGTPEIEIVDAPLPSQGTAVPENGAILFTPNEDYTAFDVPARFTYKVIVNGKESNAALITVRIDDTPEIYVPPATPSKGSGGLLGCTYNPGAPFDPTLPLLALAAIAGLAYRKRMQA